MYRLTLESSCWRHARLRKPTPSQSNRLVLRIDPTAAANHTHVEVRHPPQPDVRGLMANAARWADGTG